VNLVYTFTQFHNTNFVKESYYPTTKPLRYDIIHYVCIIFRCHITRHCAVRDLQTPCPATSYFPVLV